MVDMSGVNNSLVQSQLAGMQVRSNIGVRVAAKVLDNARAQGDMVTTLLDKAAQVMKSSTSTGSTAPTLSSVATGIGRNVDIRG